MNFDQTILPIVSFLVGVLVGWVAHTIVVKNGDKDNAKTFILLVVSVAWFASVIVEILNPEYHTNPLMHGLMGSIVGFFYNFKATPKEDGKETKK